MTEVVLFSEYIVIVALKQIVRVGGDDEEKKEEKKKRSERCKITTRSSGKKK